MEDHFTATARTLRVMTPAQRKLRMEPMGEKERKLVEAAFQKLFGEDVNSPPRA